MADILPIRPWRYNRKLSASLEALTSPLFDVVSDKQRDALYKHPYNSIHLSVPEPLRGKDHVAKLLQEWKRDGILIQDDIPAIYVYYQYFSHSSSPREYCRKGFICHIRAYDWDEKVVLRHENTIPDTVNDSVSILEKTELHSSPTLGLYTDNEFQLERYMDAAMTDPIYDTEDYQGVRNVLAVIHDAEVIKIFISVLEDKTVILADGLHRYEASLIHKAKQNAFHPGHIRKAGYNFHLMYLTNTEGADFIILPTHRLLKNLPDFDEAAIIRKLEDDFIIRPVEDMYTLPDVIAGKQWAFGIMFKDKAFKVRLKPESFEKLKWPFPDEVKRLDLTVMHYFIMEKVLKIPGKEQRKSDHLSFNHNFSDCMRKVIQSEVQMAIITNELTIEDVKRICQSGYTMPQKSTYFYPKTISGLLFTSINELEFALPFYAPF
jgi:uncharacterized protein (DUF1015 family)